MSRKLKCVTTWKINWKFNFSGNNFFTNVANRNEKRMEKTLVGSWKKSSYFFVTYNGENYEHFSFELIGCQFKLPGHLTRFIYEGPCDIQVKLVIMEIKKVGIIEIEIFRNLNGMLRLILLIYERTKKKKKKNRCQKLWRII